MPAKQLHLHIARLVIHDNAAASTGESAGSLAKAIRAAAADRLAAVQEQPMQARPGIAGAIADGVLGHRQVASRLVGPKGG
jgi:hypothetical protein